MNSKRRGVSQRKEQKFAELHAIRVGDIRPSLQTLSSTDCGIDLSGYAFAGLKKWR